MAFWTTDRNATPETGQDAPAAKSTKSTLVRVTSGVRRFASRKSPSAATGLWIQAKSATTETKSAAVSIVESTQDSSALRFRGSLPCVASVGTVSWKREKSATTTTASGVQRTARSMLGFPAEGFPLRFAIGATQFVATA